MRRFLRIAGAVLGGVVIIALMALVFLLQGPSVPEHSDYRLDLATLKQMADQPSGSRPIKINAAVVARAKVPAAFFLGGVRFDQHELVFPAYQILYSDGMIIVDAPPGRDFFEKSFTGGEFSEEDFKSEQQGLATARAIVITHEHQDHLGGIAESPGLPSFAQHLMLSREQHDDTKWLNVSKFPESVRIGLRPLDFDHYYALAPGVVLIKAPGHTVGSQIVYVHLADNSEYLLIGDVAWAQEQVSVPRCRPRLAELAMGENSGQVTAELRALHDLAESNPALHIVVSHDVRQLSDLEKSGLMGRGFTFPAKH